MNVICRGENTEDLSVDFSEQKILIGQARTDNIVVSATGISDHHAVLSEKENHLYIADNGSLNGTFVNREKISAPCELHSNDTIQIGIQQIRVEINNDSGTVILHFISNILEEDNSEDATAMTILADEKLQSLIEAERHAHPCNGNITQKIVITSTKDIFIEGREVGKYTIIKRIGKGGMGEVYLAKHKTLGTLRALKVLPREMKEENVKFFDRFMREAQLAAEIKHANIVGVMDVETDEEFGFSYIVMEYIDGGSLRRILKSSNHLSEEQSVVIVEAVAAALHAAEEKKIVHRDIKPDNIMFTKQGEVKLADLGIAKNDDEDCELTRENSMIGTPAYLSPEQAQNAKDVDIRADIYSLGATFYEMLTGQHPYPGKTSYDILHKLFYDPVPDPRRINPEISDASAGIIMKMLAKNADDRFQSAAELIDVIDKTFPPHTSNEAAELVKKAISGICEDNATFLSEITTVQMGKKWNRKWLYGTAAALLVIACIWIFFSLPLSPSPAVKPPPKPAVPVIQNKVYDLTIKTLPEAEIRIKTRDGALSVYSADNSGILKVPKLKEGSYALKISCKNHIDAIHNIMLQNDMTLESVLPLDVKKLTVRAMPKSKILISGYENQEKTAIVPDTGILVFPNLIPEESLSVSIELAGYEPCRNTIRLNKDQNLSVKQNRIRNTLMVKSIPAADVVLKQGNKICYEGVVNSGGLCIIEGIDSGTYQVRISCNGYISQTCPCDLSKSQSITADLKEIVYDIDVTAVSGTKIVLLKDNNICGNFLVPESGKMKIHGVKPGKYVILAEKEDFLARKEEITVEKNVVIDCSLKKKAVLPKQVSQQPPQPRSETPQSLPVPSRPYVAKGTICFTLDTETPDSLKKYISEHGLELCVGSADWVSVKKFPCTVKANAGEVPVKIRGRGFYQPIADDTVSVKADKNTGFLIVLYPLRSQVKFLSNKPETVFFVDGKKYKTDQKIPVETFKVYTVTAVYGSEKITQKFTSNNPGAEISVYCPFKDVVHPFQRQYEEGFMMFKEEKYKEALPLLLEAAENKHPEASYLVAEIYDRGLLGLWRTDKKEAAKWYIQAADQGCVKAAYVAAEIIRKDGTGGTVEQMLKHYATAMNNGNKNAAYQLYLFYKNGDKDIAVDEAKAFDCLKKAATLGCPDAMYDLGMMYENGTGIPANSDTALYWIKKAAEAGQKKAQDYIDAIQ